MNIVYLNGEFLPIDQAKISVTDRGFLFGDGVYEVIPVYHQRLFRAEQHLARLQRSLDAVKIPIKLDIQKWRAILYELVKHNQVNGKDMTIYMQVTRGPQAQRSHTFPAEITPTIYAQCTPLKTKSYDELAAGGHAITAPDIRWQNCHIKAITLLPNVLLSQQAKENGAVETILIRDGFAIEGASSNLFIVKNKTVITPPLQNIMLGGVTRDLVIELIKKNNVAYQEQNISEAELRNADEIWLTGSLKEILPVTKLDNEQVRNGRAGPIWQQIIKYYLNVKNNC